MVTMRKVVAVPAVILLVLPEHVAFVGVFGALFASLIAVGEGLNSAILASLAVGLAAREAVRLTWPGCSRTPTDALLEMADRVADWGGLTTVEPPRAQWRRVYGDSESLTGVAPVCPTPERHVIADRLEADHEGVYGCCPGPYYEAMTEARAARMVARLNGAER
ncbi:hypothetical protein ACFY1A_48250 [Streptomyces sp. NPDC001520]|uniref:hypothetical protein n=1 Tax=Streptomyces sp. NPDC001520 TaxID=3364581 RepID=UPI0036C84415